MGKIKAVKILNGTESYYAVVGRKFTCPDSTERIVEKIEMSSSGTRYVIHLADKVRIFVDSVNALAQFE